MNVLDLFPCSGGMAEGLRRADIHVSMAFDWDADAIASYTANMKHKPIQIDVRDLLGMAACGWRPMSQIDLLVADPPCTPWSRAGKRLGQADERDMMADTVALIRVLRPRAYLIANVPGLDDGPNWPIVQKTIGSLAGEGYCVRDFARLDAADYGVPQHRVRPFWYGHLQGPCVAWPSVTHCDPTFLATSSLPGMRPLRPWVTCGEALGHLAAEDLGTPVGLRWRGQNGKQIASVPDRPARVVGTSNLSDGNVLVTGPMSEPSEADKPSRSIRSAPRGAQALLVNDKHPINRPDRPSFTVTSKGDGRGAQGACVLEWPWDRPATTVHGDARLAPPGHHEKSFLSDNRGHGPNAVKLSEKAAAILQGFPPGWVFVGATKRARWSQIGMAVPPPLAEAVGRSIARALGLKHGERHGGKVAC